MHFLWQGCVIASIYWLICAIAPRHAATLRYWSGLAGMLLCVLVILLTFSLSLSPEARFDPHPIYAAAVNPFLILSGSMPNTWALLESGIEPALPLLVLLWFLGVIVFSTRTLRDWLGIKHLLHAGVVTAELQLQISLEKLKTSLDVQLPVRLLASTRVAVPMAIGWLRPVILMPISVLNRLPLDQLEMILAHELGHIRRGDYAFNLLQVVLETVLFYHPAISWMSRRVREDREHRCDELVVRACGRPATYARALTSLELMRSPVLSPAVAATGGNLLARIRLIIDDDMPGRGSSILQFGLVAVAGIFVAFGAQQGYSLSTELNRVAGSAQLQASDVQWKTWGHSREAWGLGVTEYAAVTRKAHLAAMKKETLSRQNLPLPPVHLEPRPGQENGVYGELLAHAGRVIPELKIESFMETERVFAGMAVKQQAAVDIVLQHEAAHNNRMTLDPASIVESGPNAGPSEIISSALDETGKADLTPLKARPPNYPWRARKKGIEGFVKLEFSLDDKGRVTDVEVLDAMPEGVFEKAASKAISGWTFEAMESPGMRYRQVFDFELQDLER
ncbi:MAG TPA: M56 family metallopeptidase, partial [Xanthomonadales bacterium]|nr:M56 family metallopeptidase [Xanthomonadales bacterium]